MGERYNKGTDDGARVMKAGREKFGAFIRREREAKEIGLRKMAKKIEVSPTYLSKVERDEFPPPAEDKVRKIAGVLGLDADELLALAGRVASDLTDIIRERPREMADFLRAAKGLTECERVNYDATNDVLYVTYKSGPASRSVEMKGGILRRYQGDNLAGITILDFASRLRSGGIEITSAYPALTASTNDKEK